MRRLVLLVSTALTMVLMLAMAAPAAFAQPLHPFCGSGQEFAQEHVVALAQNPAPGPQIAAPQAGGVHNPGLAHQGFKVCQPPPG